MKITDARSLNDGRLTTELKSLVATERHATVALIIHLAEFDRRQLYRGAGFSSMFRYCVEVLRLSEDVASSRIAAARMARRHPEVVDRLIAGSLSPTTVRLIAKRATPENGRALIEAATGKTKRQVEKLLAQLFPDRDVPASIRPLGPAPNPAPVPLATPPPPLLLTTALPPLLLTSPALNPSQLPSGNAGPPAERLEAPPTAPPVAPAPDRFAIRFTAKADTVAKLKMVQDLLSHAVPDGDLAEVFDRALTLLAVELVRKKFAITRAPRKTPDSPSAAEQPAAVQRAVYLRDRGRCTYVSKDGRRCESRRFLQFDHTQGRALGGGFTVENVRLRCGPHNRLEAERLYATPPRARDAGGARIDLTRVHSPRAASRSAPGRMGQRESSEERGQPSLNWPG